MDITQLKSVLGAAALSLVAGAASAVTFGEPSTVTTDAFALEFGDFSAINVPFETGPLTGEVFDLILDINSGFGDSFALLGESSSSFALLGDSGDELSFLIDAFDGMPSQLGGGVEVTITGFGFATGVIDTLIDLDASLTDVVFDGVDGGLLSVSATVIEGSVTPPDNGTPVAPIPLPAGVVLLGSAAAALGALRVARRTR